MYVCCLFEEACVVSCLLLVLLLLLFRDLLTPGFHATLPYGSSS